MKEIQDKVKYTQTKIQPQNKCVAMLTTFFPEPDWITLPCDEKIPTLIICQKQTGENEQSLVTNEEIQMCKDNQLPISNKCISFQLVSFNTTQTDNLEFENIIKYESFDKKLILDEHLRKVMIGYFSLIQHFYLQPIQFIVLMNSQNRFTIYQPIQTEMFPKLSWREFTTNVKQYIYDGYLLFSSSIPKMKILSILKQCKDGSYIHEQSWCDTKEDCFDGSDEQQCYCSEILENTNVMCSNACTDKSNQCSCSEIYFTCLSSFKCIPYSKLCDGHPDCSQGEDEYCETFLTKAHTNISSEEKFTCVDSNTSIPLDLVDDLVPDCLNSFEDEKRYYNFLASPKQDFNLFCFGTDELPCIPGYSICFPISKMCVYDFKYNSYHLKYCRNGAHLFNCTTFNVQVTLNVLYLIVFLSVSFVMENGIAHLGMMS